MFSCINMNTKNLPVFSSGTILPNLDYGNILSNQKPVRIFRVVRNFL